MADTAQLERALFRAHEAGDEAGARVIAEAIRAARAPQASQVDKASTSPITNLIGAAVEPNLSLLTGAVSGPLSGYAGMLGSVLPGEEGQGSRWTQAIQNALTYKPITQGGKDANSVISYPFEKLAEGADWAGGKVADVTGSPAAGAAVNAGIQAGVPIAASKFLKVTPAAETAQGSAARGLMQKAVKPSAADLKSGAAGRAMQTMLDEGINATPGGMNKAQGIVSALDPQAEAAIKNSTATVNIPTVGTYLKDNWDKASKQVNPQADMSAVMQAWKEFQNSPYVAGSTDIPVQLAHELKRGTYRSLGDKSYGELKGASTEAQKSLARGLRSEVAKGVPEAAEIMKREGDVMNVLDVAKGRSLVSGNRDPQGLSALRLDDPLVWGGAMLDRSSAFKSMLARALYGTADPRAVRAITALSASQEGRPQE